MASFSPHFFVSVSLCPSPYLIVSLLSLPLSLCLLLPPSLCAASPGSSYLSHLISISSHFLLNFSSDSQVLCPHIDWVNVSLIPQGGHPTPQSCLTFTSCFMMVISVCPVTHQQRAFSLIGPLTGGTALRRVGQVVGDSVLPAAGSVSFSKP